MEGKLKAGLLAILCLFGLSFAWGGFGMDSGWGNSFGMEKGEGKNVSLETRAEFMQAAHEGDYEAAMELHEEYGIGGPRMEIATEEMFALMGQVFEAQKAGNWLEAVELHQQLVELTRELMGKGVEAKKAACEEAVASAEVQGLFAQIKDAKEAGDGETVKSLHEQLKGLVPKGCGIAMKEKMPPKVSEECKAALEEGKDELSALKEQIKAAKEAGDKELLKTLHEQMKELVPEGCAKPPKEIGEGTEPPMPIEEEFPGED